MKDPTVILNGVNVRVDSEERYNLNDLHKSAVLGGNATESQRTGEFLERAQVKYFVQELGLHRKTHVLLIGVITEKHMFY
ncbi:DNA-binding protein [Sodalis-like symbiont of Philaenus spumarius]|nr:DNA-binding protein [Sodalis-like symbiont of Philaenus spumarius]